jgi:hypothetical protein
MYVEVPCCVRDAVRKKCPEKWTQNSWFLLNDNTPAHQPLVVKEFFAMHNVMALGHLPCSPDLSLLVFLVFTTKNVLKG